MSYIIVDVTPDTPEWSEERLGSAGASELAAVMGESSFEGRTPLGVYLDKLGAPNDFDPVLSIVTHMAEPIISAWVDWQQQPEQVAAGVGQVVGEILPGFMARRTDIPWMHASFDRVVREPSGRLVPLQLKTSNPFVKHKWEAGVPSDYVAQEDGECLILNDAPYAWLAVWHYGTDFDLYKLPANPSRQAALVERSRTLMLDHVAKRVPPPPSLGDDMTKLYPGRRGAEVFATEDVLDALGILMVTKSDLKTYKEEADAEIARQHFIVEAFMGDATELKHPVSRDLLHTWRPNVKGVRSHRNPESRKI